MEAAHLNPPSLKVCKLEWRADLCVRRADNKGGGGLIGTEGKGIEGFVGQEEDFVGDTELDLEPVKMDEVCVLPWLVGNLEAELCTYERPSRASQIIKSQPEDNLCTNILQKQILY